LSRDRARDISPGERRGGGGGKQTEKQRERERERGTGRGDIVSFYLNAPRADVSTSAAPVDLNAIRGVDAIEPAAAASAVPRRNLLMSDCRASETGIKGVPGSENWAVQRRGVAAAAAASNYRAFSRVSRIPRTICARFSPR